MSPLIFLTVGFLPLNSGGRQSAYVQMTCAALPGPRALELLGSISRTLEDFRAQFPEFPGQLSLTCQFGPHVMSTRVAQDGSDSTGAAHSHSP